jgi:2-dehydro-3-deoxyphosphogluconate aldolase/(4S)-4-hydroxy-2-oxoglutarate aldolase
VSGVQLPSAIVEERVIPVARDMTPETAPGLAEALFRGGLTVLEITVEAQGGIDAVASLRGSGATVGAGTVTSIGQAAAAIEVGAVFLVCPHAGTDLIRWANDRGVPLIPGGLTPSEIFAAWASGAPAVKVFPASLGGPDLIAAIKAPLPQIELIPTGGVTADNAAAYLAAGSLAVGVGGWLTGGSDTGQVTERAIRLIESIRLV